MNELPDVNAMTTHEAAMKYAENGIAVFPIVPNCKNPLTPNGFKDATADMDVNNQAWHRASNANVGMATGTVNGIMVVDVDCKNGVNGEESLHELEKYYGNLPVTRKHNTPSGGYHLLFRIASMAVPSSASSIGDGLDVRADGGYVVAPPSVVKNDKCSGKYIVENPEVPIADAPEWLIKIACERKSIEKNTAKKTYVPKGERNEHIFRYALDCKRLGCSNEAAIQKALVENKGCSPPLKEKEVLKTVASAYKYDVNIPTEIINLNSKHAIVLVGGKIRIIFETTNPIYKCPDIVLMAKQDFIELYGNRFVQVDGESKRLSQYWLDHPNRRQYEQIVFHPDDETERYYNLWKGFAVEPQPGECKLYLQHIKDIIANGNEQIFKYLIVWMADLVQNPGRLNGVAVVLKGKQGTGKGIYIRNFGKLFGTHYKHVSQSKHLIGNFNNHMKDCVLLYADEVTWGVSGSTLFDA